MIDSASQRTNSSDISSSCSTTDGPPASQSEQGAHLELASWPLPLPAAELPTGIALLALAMGPDAVRLGLGEPPLLPPTDPAAVAATATAAGTSSTLAARSAARPAAATCRSIRQTRQTDRQ